MRCLSCNFDNPEGSRFCASCGEPLARSCPSCGTEIQTGFRFCPSCGTGLDEAAPAVPEQGIPSERRPVTVLFADLVGFSTLAEHMDPEELRTLMSETFADLAAEVEKREGTVEKFIGDAVMAMFGVPKAHEDDPERAVETALRMHEIVQDRSASTPSPLQLRIGINSGLVVAGTVGDGTQTGVMGDAVNTAARLQQAAAPGEVIVEASVWRRIRESYDAQHIGLLEVKGREQAVDAYQVIGPQAVGARRQAPFVGRRDELALLELLWSSAAKGNTHVVSVVGEPGVGKSRLLDELPDRPGVRDVRIACAGERAFGPFLDLIERLLGRTPDDLEDLKSQSAALGVEEETALLLGAFLGLSGAPPVVRMGDEQQKRQVFAGVWQFLIAATGGQPALVVLDDVHWSDQSSLDLLGFLLERLGGVPLMLVLAYRPGFENVERAALRASHTGIRLELLTPDESVALAKGFLGVEELPADLERLVAERAEGNPFFIEELLQALLELGSLAVVNGRVVLAKVEVEIPDTVQGTILARVDRLDAKERSVLQQAAVVGRNFSTDLLDAVLGDGAPRAALEELARAQILLAEGPDRWTFKHALIQEVVYETLLLRQRKAMHRKVAEALEERAADDPAFLELLAEHYAKAEVPEKARAYAAAAGDLAAERMGFVEAKGRYETALRLWGEGDEEGRLELMMKLAQAAHLSGDETAARTTLLEAEAGWRALGDTVQAGVTLAWLGRVNWVIGDVDRATEALDQAIALIEPHGPTPQLIQAIVWASTLNMLTGQLDQSVALASRGMDLEKGLNLVGPRSHLLNNLGICAVMGGDVTGLDNLKLALRLAEEAGEVEAIGRGYANISTCLLILSENRKGLEICRRGREVIRRLGGTGFAAFQGGYEARMLAELGRYEEAEALSRELLTTQRGVFGAPGLVNAGLGLCPVLIRRGRYTEARQLLDEILPSGRRVGGGYFAGHTLTYEAELEEARGNFAAARQALGEAVRVLESARDLVPDIVLVPVVRLLPRQVSNELLERVRRSSDHPSYQARLAEAEAYLEGDRAAFQRAADLNASLELPYQEARCRLEARELERAADIIKEYGLQDGPLGARLRELTAAG